MNVYKFGVKPKITQPKTIFWKPAEMTYMPKKINSVTWDIFVQKDLTLKPGETKTIALGFGFLMSRGVVLISLSEELKLKEISLTNEVILEEIDDIVTTISNNSNKSTKIDKNTFLCRLYYSI